MDAKEYILMMGLTHGGSMEQKLKASFQMFDADGNGNLDPQEIKEMFLLIVNQVCLFILNIFSVVVCQSKANSLLLMIRL